jgi:hypothetical protein
MKPWRNRSAGPSPERHSNNKGNTKPDTPLGTYKVVIRKQEVETTLSGDKKTKTLKIYWFFRILRGKKGLKIKVEGQSLPPFIFN